MYLKDQISIKLTGLGVKKALPENHFSDIVDQPFNIWEIRGKLQIVDPGYKTLNF
jgi:hypothetical protein